MVEKIALVALNSQYAHSNLAVHYIKQSLSGYDCVIVEDNINQKFDVVLDKISCTGANIFGFSTYIFNVEYVKKIALSIKKIFPDARILFGGPEAEKDSENLLQYCDNIINGEGEKSFLSFLKSDRTQKNYFMQTLNTTGDSELAECARTTTESETGECSTTTTAESETADCNNTTADNKTIKCATISKKLNNKIIVNTPYTEEYFESVKDKLAYFEATRGCPFKCSYCMSGGTGVRYFDLEFIKGELAKFFHRDIRGLKFVDRTFNLANSYSKKILKFIIQNEDKYPFGVHFEVAPELFDEEYFEIIKESKLGILQFELGMQTLNEDSLKAVNRKNDSAKIVYNITRLKQLGNCILHCDLIAGLPFEDITSFAVSFDLLYSLQPTEIQVGTLKVLKGSKLKEDICGIDGWAYDSEPPYVVRKTPYMSECDMKTVRLAEIAVNKLYNSGRFKKTLDYIVEGSPFAFFCDLANYCGDMNGKHLAELSQFVIDYCEQRLCYNENKLSIVKELLRFDYYITNSSKITPKCLFKKYSDKFLAFRKEEQVKRAKLMFFETNLFFENFELEENSSAPIYQTVENGIFYNKSDTKCKNVKIAETASIISVDYSQYKNIDKEFGWRVVKLLD